MSDQVKSLLARVGCSEFADGIVSWGYPRHSYTYTYTDEDMERLSKMTSAESSDLKSEINELKQRLADLDDAERKLLRDHVMNGFAWTVWGERRCKLPPS